MAEILDKDLDLVLHIGSLYNVRCTMPNVVNARQYIPAMKDISATRFIESIEAQLKNIEQETEDPWPQIEQYMNSVVKCEGRIQFYQNIRVKNLFGDKEEIKGKRLGICSENYHSIIYVILTKL